jgi:hypothetical protein
MAASGRGYVKTRPKSAAGRAERNFSDFFRFNAGPGLEKRTKQELVKTRASFRTASVDLTRSPHRLAMTAICAYRAGIDVKLPLRIGSDDTVAGRARQSGHPR